MRRKIVAGNWKMNNDLPAAQELSQAIAQLASAEVQNDATIVVAPPFPFLLPVAQNITGSKNVHLGAQNCHQAASGAYTGEISAPMLKSLGAQFVIIGHSERREYFGETDQLLATKTDAVLANGLTPIFCCGESLDIREAGTQNQFVAQQLTDSLFHLSSEQITQVVLAYEPIWAIGTGKTATAQQAQQMHQHLRSHLATQYGHDVASQVSILYGGSCKPGNAKEIFAGADVDGGLIGGASLKARDFIDIILAL